MSWAPTAEFLGQLVGLFRDSNNPDSGRQSAIASQLAVLQTAPDYPVYLAYILTQLKSESSDVRAVAGLDLKNRVKNEYHWFEEHTAFCTLIQQMILSDINDPVPDVRRTIGTIITTMINYGELDAVPSLFMALEAAFNSGIPDAQDGALNCFFKLCEDHAQMLCETEPDFKRPSRRHKAVPVLGGARPLVSLIPRMIEFMQSPNEVFRRDGLGALVQLIPFMPNALRMHMDTLMKGLFALANDPSKPVRRRVCQAFVGLVENMEFLKPFMRDICQYMLHCTQDEHLALDACEFWSAIADDAESCKPILREFLPTLVPLLLEGMVYSDVELALLDIEEDDSSKADRPEDINPALFFHQAAMKGASKQAAATSGSIAKSDATSDDEGDADDDEDEDDEDGDEISGQWTLRKCSATGLDTLSTVFNDEILPHLLPSIQAKLAHAEWYHREVGVLAIGAIAEGCSTGMTAYLPQLLPFLVSLLSDSKALVRSITCWTISRYANWIAENHAFALQPVITGILERCLDKSKKVQEAAISALAILEEECMHLLSPFVVPILNTLNAGFTKFQAKNLVLLYDALGTLADSLGEELAKPELIPLIMMPLQYKWQNVADDDKQLFQLFECMTAVAQALGVHFAAYAPAIFDRCRRLIESTLRHRALVLDSDEEMPDPTFIVVSLDLISGLVETLGAGMSELFSSTNMLPLLNECFSETHHSIRQSAFALLGDVGKNCTGVIRPYISTIAPLCIEYIDDDFIAVANNAAWSLGEIAIRVPAEEIAPHVPAACKTLVPLMINTELNASLLENVAITLGRLGGVAAAVVAPELASFAENMCQVLRTVNNNAEKEHASRGLCMLIQANPSGIIATFGLFCSLITSWAGKESAELRGLFQSILSAFKQHMGAAQWTSYISSFPEEIRSELASRYAL